MEPIDFYHIFRSIDLHFNSTGFDVRKNGLRVRGAANAKILKNKLFSLLSSRVKSNMEAVVLCSICHVYRSIIHSDEWIVSYMINALEKNSINDKIQSFSDMNYFSEDFNFIGKMLQSTDVKDYLGLNPFVQDRNLWIDLRELRISPESVIFLLHSLEVWDRLSKEIKDTSRWKRTINALNRYRILLGDSLCAKGAKCIESYIDLEREKDKLLITGIVQEGENEWLALFQN